MSINVCSLDHYSLVYRFSVRYLSSVSHVSLDSVLCESDVSRESATRLAFHIIFRELIVQLFEFVWCGTAVRSAHRAYRHATLPAYTVVNQSMTNG